MEFCENCDNMLYLNIKEDEEGTNKLEYRCANCNFIKQHNPENSSVLKIDFNIDEIKKTSIINPYIYDDITLPKAEGIHCPNKQCPKPKNGHIKYIQYDKENMKFIYICLECYKAKIEPHIW